MARYRVNRAALRAWVEQQCDIIDADHEPDPSMAAATDALAAMVKLTPEQHAALIPNEMLWIASGLATQLGSQLFHLLLDHENAPLFVESADA